MLSLSAKVRRLLLITLIALFPVAGCESLTSQVSRLTDRTNFTEAKERLERRGVGDTVLPEAKPEDLEARVVFERAVAAWVHTSTHEAMTQGHARAAFARTGEAKQLAPWSESVSGAYDAYATILADIDRLTSDMSAAPEADRRLYRDLLVRAVLLRHAVSDSPLALAAIRRSGERFVQTIAADLASAQAIDTAALEQLRADLALFRDAAPSPGKEVSRELYDLATYGQSGANGRDNHTITFAQLVSDLEMAATIDAAPLRRVSDIAQGLSTRELEFRPIVYAVFERLAAQAAAWHESANISADYDTIDALFGMRAAMSYLGVVPAEPARAASLQRSVELAAHDRTLSLAWLYRELGAAGSGGSAARTQLPALQRIDAMPASAAFSVPTISVSVDVSVDAAAANMAERVLVAVIAASTKDERSWKWVDARYETADVAITVSSVDMRFAALDGLRVVQSTYLSHYQNVPNPQKAFLEGVVASRRISLQFAESQFRSAVSSHNMYPTMFSLQYANTAESSYIMALNSYNSSVAMYNSTPSTVREPVHLPYQFREGTVEAGFVIGGTVTVNGVAANVVGRSMDRDFVRTGSRREDNTVSRRSDDALDLDVSAEAQLLRLWEAAERWIPEVAQASLNVDVAPGVPLHPEERRALNWLSGPIASSLGPDVLPEWMRDEVTRFNPPVAAAPMPTIPIFPPDQRIESVDDARSLTVELIVSNPGSSSLSHGSGAIIGPEGLVITCAHVLVGSEVVVRVNVGPLQGEYPAQVVFADSKTDVALLKAQRLANNSWFEVDLDTSPKVGTSVRAIGSPSVGVTGATASTAVTEGVIATDLGTHFGQPRLIVDVNIASGSSGGPIVDEDWTIVGLVTAVSSPEFTSQRASTGSLCIAAPASLFDDWLGLTFEEAPESLSIPDGAPGPQ